MKAKDTDLKRIILFSHNSNLSGAPISLTQLAGKLLEYGYSPLIVIPKHGPMEDLIKRLNIDYIILKSPGRLFKFIRIVLREKAALIHVNSLVTTWPVLISQLIRKPVIWHVREYLGDKKLYARIIHLISTRVVVVSHQQFNLFKGMKKAILVPDGIDFSAFEDTKSMNILKNKNYKPIIVTYIGTIEPRKGLLILAQAATFLQTSASLEKKDIHFFIIGEAPVGHEDYKENIIKFLIEHNLLDRFHFLGVREEIPQILTESDILCHPAFIEVFGLVVIEGMASKLPVVATKVGEIPWIIEDGKTGFVVEPGDPEKLANAIEKLASNKKLREDMGFRAYKKAKKLYNINIHAKRIARIYNEIIMNK